LSTLTTTHVLLFPRPPSWWGGGWLPPPQEPHSRSRLFGPRYSALRAVPLSSLWRRVVMQYHKSCSKQRKQLLDSIDLGEKNVITLAWNCVSQRSRHVGLEEVERFARRFKRRRIALGKTVFWWLLLAILTLVYL